MNQILASFLIFFQIFVYGQEYDLRIEVRNEENNELIPGVKIEFTNAQKNYFSSTGVFEVKTRQSQEHIHITSLGFETYELDIDLISKSTYIAYLHLTSIELKESVIQHSLISSSDRNASITITGIDKNALLISNANSLAENLEAIPGVSSINVGVGIAKPVIRGLSGTRIVIADAGLKQEGQQWGNDHGLEMDQYGIERLEVIKGPASIIFGPDAMGGVVHVLPEIWPEEGKMEIDVLAGGKSNNEQLFSSLGVKGLKKNVFFNIRSSYKTYGDMMIPSDSFNYQTFRLPVYDNRLKNTAGNEFNIATGLGYKGDWGKVFIRSSIYKLHQGLFSGAIGVPQAYGLGHENDYRNIELPSQHVLHSKIDGHGVFRFKKSWINFDLGYQRNNRLEQSLAHLHGFSPDILSDTAHHFILETYQFRLTTKKTFSQHTKLSTGITGLHQQNRISGFEFLIPNYTSLESGLYGLFEHNFTEKWATNVGGRIDFSRVQSLSFVRDVYSSSNEIISTEELAPAIDRTFVNGGAQAGFSFTPNHNSNFKLNFGKTYRFPRAVELAVNGVHHGTFRHEKGDPNLKPENGYQFDLAYEYHTSKHLLLFTPFFNYYSNFIFLRPSGKFSPLPDAGQIYQYTQANAVTTGAELHLEYHPWDWWHIAYKSQYVYGYNLDAYRNLPFMPPLEMTLEFEFMKKTWGKLNSLYTKPSSTYVSSQNKVDANELVTPSYFLLNLDIGCTIQLTSKQTMIVNLGIRNMLNTTYYRHLSRYRILDLSEQGINIIGSLRFPIKARI
jgi:iron complex outermembrane recepter protein